MSIPFALPEIGQAEIDEITECLKSGWITTGPRTLKFEENFKDYIGADFALAVSSATAGLHLALDAIGLASGECVITTTFTFTASAEVIRYFNAHPIFCDIDPRTLNIDVDDIEKKDINLSFSRGKKLRPSCQFILPVKLVK